MCQEKSPKVHPSPFSPCLSESEARLKRSNGIKVKASTMNLTQGEGAVACNNHINEC